MITKLSSVPIYVTDYEEALDFWIGKMGFVVTGNMESDGLHWITVAPTKNSSTQLSFTPVSGDHPESVERVGTATGYVFYTDNIETLYRKLVEKGVFFSEPPKRLDWGGIEAVFEDPDGNSYELVQNAA